MRPEYGQHSSPRALWAPLPVAFILPWAPVVIERASVSKETRPRERESGARIHRYRAGGPLGLYIEHALPWVVSREQSFIIHLSTRLKGAAL